MVRGEGQLLFGGVPGDGRGGMDGTGGQHNSGTSVAFADADCLTQLKEKHAQVPLRVSWDNAHGPSWGSGTRVPQDAELALRLVNRRATAHFNADEAVWGWAREESLAILCLGSRAAVQAGRQIPGRAVQPERRGETALPDGPIKGRNTPARLPPRFPAPGKCTSHPGFGTSAVEFLIVAYARGDAVFQNALRILDQPS